MTVQQAKQESKVRFDWRTIPAGEFLMGSDPEIDKNAYRNETPQHRVYLLEYQISRTPVTNEMWRVFLDSTSYVWAGKDRYWAKGMPTGKGNHPVVYVSWYDAIAFCEWAGVRLPSEAEWEKAARGTEGWLYPWGNDRPTEELCKFSTFSEYVFHFLRVLVTGKTDLKDCSTEVGKYSPHGDSPYGLSDVAGNVWEWTSSAWGMGYLRPEFGYPYDPDDGREYLGRDTRRIQRGGSWTDRACHVRVALRDKDKANAGSPLCGFRCVGLG